MVIKVGVIEKKPFIINKDKLSGFTIDIWENIAKKHNIKYKYYTIKKGDKIDDIIESNKYDVILGVVALTPERVRKIDFTVPYYFTHFSLVNKKRDEKKKIYEDMAKYTMLLFSYILLSMTIYYILHSKEKVKINEIIYNTLKNMSPITFSQKDTDFHSRINYFFGWFFVILLFVGIYNRFFNNIKTEDIIKKPILVDSKNTMLIKYLKSRGAKVKIVNNSGGLNNLLDMYLGNNKELAGIFVSEEGKIHKDGSIFDKNPKYQGLKFNRHNFGKSQVSILVRKNHPLYNNINSTLMKLKETGELHTISKKWLHKAHNKQLEF